MRRWREDPSVFLRRRTRIVDGDFVGRTWEDFGPEGVVFERCRFDDSVFESACFGSGRRVSRYTDCTFDGSRIRATAPGKARMERCSFRNVHIKELFAHELELVDCVFSGRLVTGILSAAVPEHHVGAWKRSRNEIRGNDFSQAELIDFDFSGGIDLHEQKLPSGPDYLLIEDLSSALRRVRQNLPPSTDSYTTDMTRGFLGSWDFLLQTGQTWMLLRPKDYNPRERTVLEPLLRVMLDSDQSPAASSDD